MRPTPLLTALALTAAMNAQQSAAVPIEFGTVAWQRDFAAATAAAKQRGAPLLVLFQEVPG